MYNEIDRSGQSKWNAPAIIIYLCLMGIVLLRLLDENLIGTHIPGAFDLMNLFGFGPGAAVLLGSLVGFLRKRTVKINVDRLEFESQSREYSDFGTIYYEGDFKTGELGGSPPHICGLLMLLFATPFLGFGMLFMMPTTIDSFLFPAFLIVEMTLLYPLGIWLGYLASPIRSKFVSNPLAFLIKQHLTKEDVLRNVEKCELVDSIIIRYRHGKGQDLRAIDDVHAFLKISSEPQLEVEMTLEKMENIGPEFTFRIDSALGVVESGEVDVDGRQALLTSGEDEGGAFIRMRYTMGKIRLRMLLGSSKKLCKLLGALLERVQPHVSFTLVPKAYDGQDEGEPASVEDSFE